MTSLMIAMTVSFLLGQIVAGSILDSSLGVKAGVTINGSNSGRIIIRLLMAIIALCAGAGSYMLFWS